MKWNFALQVLLASTFSALAINHSHVYAQPPGQMYQQPANQQPANQQPAYYQPAYGQPSVPQYSFVPQPNQHFSSVQPKRNVAFIIKKDGSLDRIEKEPGVPFSPEEVKQTMEARQKLQAAVGLIKSPDADDARKKEAKQLIANYLKAEFQWDQEGRREQVERLEKQVVELKKQWSKREESQDKLIELRMQLLENDATGLSFPESWSNISSGPMSGPSMGPPSLPQYHSPILSGPGMIYAPNQTQHYPGIPYSAIPHTIPQPQFTPNLSQPPKGR